MKTVMAILGVLLLAPLSLLGDAGILIPMNKAQPDPAVLSLEEMQIDVRIDNGDARVFVRQIFANHTPGIQEGNYIFALPSQATVSDFAVWDGPTRIPAVILERKRAEELYAQLKRQAIDPGLLQMGERGAEEAKRGSVFSARIMPIPAYGTKRLELEYHERITVENFKSYFAIPLRPDAYQAQSARYLKINFQLHSAHVMRGFQAAAKTFPLTVEENTAHTVRASFEGRNVSLAEDFVASYELDPAAADTLQVISYRNPAAQQPSPTETAPVRETSQPGFFQAEAVLGYGQGGQPLPVANVAAAGGAPRNVIALFDTSLSMQWEKLERSYRALESLLRTLRPQDRFNLLLFNTEVRQLQASAVSADAGSVQRALEFVRSSRLRGGTDLQHALEAALAQCASAGGNSYLVLLSDGGATRGIIAGGKLAAWYAGRWKQLGEAQRPRTYIFAVGDDANLPLLRLLAQNDGVLEQVLSTEPIEFKLNSFLSKIGRSPVGQLNLAVVPEASVDAVYPLQSAAFSGTLASWVGRYEKPQPGVSFTVRGVREGRALQMSSTAALPAQALDHAQLPRLWGRARVDALLEKIERQGEDQATIDEIIRLARKYKFVTPYTSFLAVPRALLRPRVIRPGDPVLRVKTDESIVSVIALFPFGLIQKLRYLASEDVWETRFLAPADMRNGTYVVRLILRDGAGHTYRESKTFVIASTPPLLHIRLEQHRLRRGQVLDLRVSASPSTRTLIARLEGAAPVELRWDPRLGANTGQLVIPPEMLPGSYHLTVTGEDIAHNLGSQEATIEVMP